MRIVTARFWNTGMAARRNLVSGHDLLSDRLRSIHTLFGQVPDVLEDALIAVALGEKETARKHHRCAP